MARSTYACESVALFIVRLGAWMTQGVIVVFVEVVLVLREKQSALFVWRADADNPASRRLQREKY
ncbi:hypothetical protein [Bradyrhizobium sp. URHC0002]